MANPSRATQEASTSDAKPTRRHDLDALRVFVVIGLVFFHSASVFDTGEFHVKNEPNSEIVDAFIAFAVMWGMPLLFVIAGIGIWHSLQSRDLGEFAAERTKRLLVPLIFGTLVILPPQIWYRVRVETGRWPDYRTFYRDFLDIELNLKGFPFVIRSSPTTEYFEYGAALVPRTALRLVVGVDPVLHAGPTAAPDRTCRRPAWRLVGSGDDSGDPCTHRCNVAAPT